MGSGIGRMSCKQQGKTMNHSVILRILLLGLSTLLSGCQQGGPSRPVITPDATGKIIVNLPEDNGRVVDMKVGNSVKLVLGDGFKWQLAGMDSALFQLEADRLIKEGKQPTGDDLQTYKAITSGTAAIEVTGDPMCRDDTPPCDKPDQYAEIEIKVH